MRFFETISSFLSGDYLIIHVLKSYDRNTVTALHLVCCVCAFKAHSLQQKKPMFHRNVRLAVASGVTLLPPLLCRRVALAHHHKVVRPQCFTS